MLRAAEFADTDFARKATAVTAPMAAFHGVGLIEWQPGADLGKQLVAVIAEQGAGVWIGLQNPIGMRVDDKNGIVGMLENGVEPSLPML
nr:MULTISPECIES: hypothetical protein [Thiorhodovibrio]